MDVEIMLLKIIVGNPVFRTHGPHIGQGCLGGFLHHITQLSGHQKASLARHHIDFYLKGIASHTGPGQAADNSDFIFLIGIFKGHLFLAQIFF